MSRKHSFSPLLAVLSSISFIVCCIATTFYICSFLFLLSLKTEATGSSRHRVVLSPGHTSYTASPPPPPDISSSCLCRGRHMTRRVQIAAVTAGSMMKGRRQKSQCEAGALDISALGAGPEVRNRNGIVLHGSASSLVYECVCGGAGGRSWCIDQIWIK